LTLDTDDLASADWCSKDFAMRQSGKLMFRMRYSHPMSDLHRVLPCTALLVFAGAFLLASAGGLRAQGLPAGPGHSSVSEETTQEFNQRLKQSTKKIADLSPESRLSGESQIGPDDLLAITIFEAPEMNRTLRVSSNGEISMELLGTLKAAGLTPRQLEVVLEELLRRSYMKDPHVGVFVQELQSHPVSVVGAVKNPGVFQVRGSKTVIELLSQAEGLADDAGDTVWIMRGAGFTGTEGVELQRNAGGRALPASGDSNTGASAAQAAQDVKDEIVKVNLRDLLESADPALNVSVYPGDIVKVTRAGIVYVVGEVQKPGGFVLSNSENISVLQALALAQGLTRTSAKSQARIIRTDPGTGKRTEIPMDLGKILSSKAPDLALQPKDIVFVPNSSAKSAFYHGTTTILSAAAGAAIYRWY
jgi:polysaccharide biosynthesis/export protein